MFRLLSIMVVDDNPNDRLAVVRELRHTVPKARIEEVADEAAYIRSLHVGKYDVVVADDRLPWANGILLTRECRAAWPSCRVILFGRQAEESARAAAKEAGAQDYFAKAAENLPELTASVCAALVTNVIEEARISTARYRELTAFMSEGLLRLSLEGTIVAMNDALARQLGFPNSTAPLRLRLGALLAEEERNKQDWRSFVDPGNPDGVATRLRTTHGVSFAARLKSRLITDASHAPVAYECIVPLAQASTVPPKVDCSQPSPAQCLAMIGASHSILTLAGPDGIIRHINPAIQNVLGFAASEMVGRLSFGFVDPRDERHVRALFAKTVAKPGGSFSVHLRARHKSGISVWLDATATNCLNAPGVEAIVVSARDISQAKRAEHALNTAAQALIEPDDPSPFLSLATKLAEALEFDSVLVAELVRHPQPRLRLLGFLGPEGEETPADVPLADSPWGQLLSRRFVCHARGVRKVYPGSSLLQTLGAESFVGLRLCDARGRVLGMLSAISQVPIGNIKTIRAVLQIFATKAACELGRRLAQTAHPDADPAPPSDALDDGDP